MLMLDYDMPLYRPPSEGRNLIIQVTLGCSFNRCTFCSMYRNKVFKERDIEEIFADIDRAAAFAPETRRVFLADGDALVISTSSLLQILGYLKQRFPKLSRVSSYALPANLIKKTQAELKELMHAGLTLLYYGLESGSAMILKKIKKGAQPDMMIEGLNKATHSGMKISATVVLGLGGKQHAQEHIEETASLVNQTALTYLSTLQLGLDATIRDDFLKRFAGSYEAQDDLGMLMEQIHLVKSVNPAEPVIFRSNHASNALPLAGNLPKDRGRLLRELYAAHQGAIPLMPQWFRSF